MINNKNKLMKLIEVDNGSYPLLVKAFNENNKPILIVGPVHCGKKYSVNKYCRENARVFYTTSIAKSLDEIYGDTNENGEFQKTPLFQAYVNGEVFYLDELLACPTNMLKNLIALQESSEHTFSCGTFKKHPNFRVVISVDADSIKPSTTLMQKVNLIKFTYDAKVEAHLCPDEELYEFLTVLRKVAKKHSLDLIITTETFKRLYEMSCLNSFKKIDLVKSVLRADYTRATLNLLIDELGYHLADNQYYETLKTIL